MPSHDSYRSIAELGRRIARHVPTNATVNVLFLPETQIHYYVDRPIRLGHTREVWETGYPKTLPLATTPEVQYVLTSTDYLDQFQAAGEVRILDSAVRQARHVYDKDRLSLLEFRARPQTASGGDATRK
jgi:hypothetical protein